MDEIYDTIIIGSGAGGLSAGIYAGRYQMNTLIISKQFGGEGITAGIAENYPGFKSIDGFDLMIKMKEQAEGVGAKLIDGEVTKISKSDDDVFVVSVGDKKYNSKTVILGLGSNRRRLGLPNEKELTGKGVHFCMTCDGPLYKGKTIAVVGGGDASVKGIILSAEYADKIYLIAMEKELMAEPINIERMKALGDKVEILYETQVKEIIGDDKFEKVILNKEFNGTNELNVDGLFIEIGSVPNVGIAKDLGVNLDKAGFINVDNMMKTNIDGVFACGDTVNHFGHFKQYVTAAATGAVSATSAFDYLKK